MDILTRPNKYVVIGILALSLWLLISSIRGQSDHLLADELIFTAHVQEIADQYVSDDAIDRGAIEQELLLDIDLPGGVEHVRVLNDYTPVRAGAQVYVKGSFIGEPEQSFYVLGVKRASGMWMLAIIFVLISIAVGGYKGARALVGLLFSLAIIFTFIVPRILSGMDPVFAGLTGATFILIVALYVSHGFNKTSIAALIGIGITLVIVGLVATTTVSQLYLTGFAAEESVYLNQESQHVLNLVGLLVAGIIIAVIGVLDDVAVTQAAIVQQLRSANKDMSEMTLFRRAMNIGRDHIAAVINTLVLAYVGASLPLILLLTVRDFDTSFVLNSELVAEEVVRTLLSSIGLVLAVPITTAVAVLLYRNRRS